MNISTINPFEDSRWDQFVHSHKHGSIYHSSAWMKVIEETYKYIPRCYVLENDQGQIVSGVPFCLIKSKITGHRSVSLPFAPFCDLLCTETDNNDFLLHSIKEELNRHSLSFYEIKPFFAAHLLEENGFRKVTNYKLHLLPLNDSLDKIRSRFHKTCIQRNIKKAERNPLEVTDAPNEQDIKDFYHLYVLTKKKHGAPPHRYLFFKNLWEHFRSKGLVEVLLAKYKGQTIAGTMLFKFKDSYYYHFAASGKKFLDLKPNHLLLWKAIKQAHEEGYKYFHFGKSAADQTGLVLFKRRWGTEEYELPYFYYPEVRSFESLGKHTFGFRVLEELVKKSPAFLLKIGGNMFSRYLG